MQNDGELHVAALSTEHGQRLAQLFERAGCSCYCRYWHFDGDKNAWLDRRAHHPELNRSELLAKVQADSAEARGLVALPATSGPAVDNSPVVGWMKLAPAPSLPKLTGQRPYRGLGVVERGRADSYIIGCFLVDPEWRRRGVARALLRAAPAIARSWGATSLQAFPYRAPVAAPDLLWMGPAELLLAHGFRELSSVGPYPVLRLDL